MWFHDPTRKVGVCHKLINKWKGPYLVTRKLDDLVYLVKKSPRQPVRAYHLDRLLPYHGKNIPQWVVKMKKMRIGKREVGILDLGARLNNKKITAMRGSTSSVFLGS